MERSLAHIEKIINIVPIEGADKIELATILGWQVVVRKEEFKVGDLAVYIEIDSVLPECKEFEFMRERKFRVRTIKLRKTLSQGILFPLSILPEKYRNKSIGFDCTEILGITKYLTQTEEMDRQIREPEGRLWKFIKRNKATRWLSRYNWFRNLFYKQQKNSVFPPWIVKTDEQRLQNIPNILQTGGTFSMTEKLDGTSFTAFLRRPNEFGICSRNQRRDKDVNSVYYKVADRYKIKEILKYILPKTAKSIVLQGEILGPDIQGNKYNLETYKLFVFNLIIDNVPTPTKEIENILKNIQSSNLIQIPNVVPVIYETELKKTVDEMLDLATGKSVINPNIHREGIVCRKDNISFKVVSPAFLLKYEGD
jgi:hypothetical protein